MRPEKTKTRLAINFMTLWPNMHIASLDNAYYTTQPPNLSETMHAQAKRKTLMYSMPLNSKLMTYQRRLVSWRNIRMCKKSPPRPVPVLKELCRLSWLLSPLANMSLLHVL